MCATTGAAVHAPEHLEKLFDTFEETSWASSAIPTQDRRHRLCSGVFGAVNTPESKMEDVLHWASSAVRRRTARQFESEVEGWNPLICTTKLEPKLV